MILLLAACINEASRTPTQPAIPTVVVVRGGSGEGAVILPPSGNADVSLDDATLIAMGETLYLGNCAPCHQPNGEGNLATFPALNRNAFVTVSDPTAVIDTVLNGRELMPAFAVTLSAQEVAAVISYIRNAWKNQAPTVNAQQVRSMQGGVESAPTQ